MYFNLTLMIGLYFALLVDTSIAYLCCDQLNSNTRNTDCTCSDQTGGIGTCLCSTLPNTRQGWLCIKNSNGDSVNISKFKNDSHLWSFFI